ncbi:MAG: hypothetical protein H6Q05_2382 [Acidobacteria bacterium]|nr:hypothetical protein [Acidobacteriota bacterium]
MKRLPFLIFVLLTAGGILPAGQDKGPSIAFDSIAKNFGKATEGETLRHVFKFTNKGSAPLEVISVNASCGCTSTLLSSQKIAPGQSGQLEVTIATEGLNTPEINKTVSITSNDPRQPQVILSLTAELVPEFVISEPSVYFGTNPRGKEVSKEILVTIPPDKAIELVSAISTDENVTVRLEPVAGSSGKKVKVIAVQKPTAPEGYHFGNLVIKTTSKLRPELKISVRGIVVKGS